MTLPIGATAPGFTLTATNGSKLSLQDIQGIAMTMVVFSCNHCPYVHAYEPRIFAIIREHEPKGLGAVFINSNNAVTHPQDSFDHMVARHREQSFPCPYLHDESQAVAKAYGAQRTPEIYLFDAALKLRYHGRVDEEPYEPAKARQHDLVRAVGALLAGEDPPAAQTQPVGCTIKWK